MPRRDKTSRAEYARQYQQANRDRLLEYSRQYNETNRDARREKGRAYYRANRDRRSADTRERRESNLEQSDAYQRQYRIENRDRRVASDRERRTESRSAYEREIKSAKNSITKATAVNEGRRWTPDDEEILQDARLTTTEKALLLGRSYVAVQLRRQIRYCSCGMKSRSTAWVAHRKANPDHHEVTVKVWAESRQQR